MKRGLISMLAAGLLAAGALVTTTGIAPAGAAAQQQSICSNNGPFFFHVTKNGVNYFLGTPNRLFLGAPAILKPMTNSTTLWIACISDSKAVLKNRGLALTSRSFSPGANVPMEVVGNNGDGFASQQWTFTGSNPETFKNVKTGLFLRVRTSGPVMFQTVTTGLTSTAWIVSG